MTDPTFGLAPGSASAFPRVEFDARVSAVRRLLRERGVDLLLVTAPDNVYYLCGHQTVAAGGVQCLGVPADGEPFLLVRAADEAAARLETYLGDVAVYPDTARPAVSAATLLARKGWLDRKVAIDRQSRGLSVASYDSLVAALGPLADGSGLVDALRAVKSPVEQLAIEEAARQAEAGMRAGIAAAQAGASENDVAAALMAALIAAGSEPPAMEPVVASGPRSDVAGATWRRRTLQPGDALRLEVAGCFDRYHAALTRTVWLGPAPERARRMVAACEEGLAAALAAMRPGASCESVHAACREAIARSGYLDRFGGRTGESLGIAFAPDRSEPTAFALAPGVARALEPGMVFHVSPALRDPGRFAVGVGETVVVTADGARPLTAVARGLVEA